MLALRYPKSSHDVYSNSSRSLPLEIYANRPFQIRRFQVRFRDEADLMKILNILKDLGLVPTDVVPAVSSTPPSSSTTPAVLPFVNGATNPSSFGSMVPTLGQATPTPPIRNGSQSVEFKVPVRPATASSMTLQSSSPALSRYHSVSNRPQSATSMSSFMSQSKPYHIDTLKRSQSLYALQVENQHVSTGAPRSVSPSPFHTSFHQQLHNNQGDIFVEGRQTQSTSPFFPLQATSAPLGLVSSESLIKRGSYSEHFDNLNKSANSAGRLGDSRLEFDALECRPKSLPNEHDKYSNLPLPPKRELPFVTVNGKKCNQPQPASTSGHASEPMAVSISRKRSLDEFIGHEITSSMRTTTPTKTAPKRRVASRKPSVQKISSTVPSTNVNSASKKATDNALTTDAPGNDTPLPTSSYATVMESTSSKSSRISPKQAAIKELCEEHHSTRTPMVNSATQTQTLSGRDHTAAIRVSQPVSAVDASTNTTNLTPSNFQDDLEVFLKKRGNESQVELPPDYTEASDDIRHRMINDFICQNLENERFLKLANDMEVSWRRLGFGR
ncbi:hypothetical protein ACMFMF_002073 [Clarireedia jacksonii]